jgi:hypothetical protein
MDNNTHISILGLQWALFKKEIGADTYLDKCLGICLKEIDRVLTDISNNLGNILYSDYFMFDNIGNRREFNISAGIISSETINPIYFDTKLRYASGVELIKTNQLLSIAKFMQKEKLSTYVITTDKDYAEEFVKEVSDGFSMNVVIPSTLTSETTIDMVARQSSEICNKCLIGESLQPEQIAAIHSSLAEIKQNAACHLYYLANFIISRDCIYIYHLRPRTTSKFFGGVFHFASKEPLPLSYIGSLNSILTDILCEIATIDIERNSRYLSSSKLAHEMKTRIRSSIYRLTEAIETLNIIDKDIFIHAIAPLKQVSNTIQGFHQLDLLLRDDESAFDRDLYTVIDLPSLLVNSYKLCNDNSKYNSDTQYDIDISLSKGSSFEIVSVSSIISSIFENFINNMIFHGSGFKQIMVNAGLDKCTISFINEYDRETWLVRQVKSTKNIQPLRRSHGTGLGLIYDILSVQDLSPTHTIDYSVSVVDELKQIQISIIFSESN